MVNNTPAVLIVEDNEQLADLYCKVLAYIGLQAMRATSVHEALERLGEVVPNIVLLDMQMKDGNGRAIVGYLKTNIRFKLTEIVIISGGSQYRSYAEEQGIEYFLEKPVSTLMLIDFIKRLLGGTFTFEPASVIV